MSYLGATLTLPGIAGVILTFGMALDANILVFERIREEIRNGKTVRSAIDAGFGKVFWTLVDTHLTTVIAAVLLFQFGTGPVKGFALSLVIGLAASMFTAIFVSRLIFELVLGEGKRVEHLSI
jgi:preprotein translocase subunit SecD